MTTYNGNQVVYGGSGLGRWYVRVNITNTEATTAGTVTVSGTIQVITNGSLYDSSNLASWNIDGQTGSANNYGYSTSVATTFTIGSFSFEAAVNYGSQRSITVYATVDNLASGDTGPSTINTTYALPARLPAIPSTPSAPSISSVGQSEATVNMTLPANNGSTIVSTEYTLYDAPTGGSVVDSYVSSTASTSYQFTGLDPETTYYAVVTATNGVGESAESARTSFSTTEAIAPDAPAEPNVTSITQTGGSASWSTPEDNGSTITGYRVQVATSAAFGSPIIDINTSASPYALTGLTMNTQYYVRVRASSLSGYSSWSTAHAFTTSPGVPGAPGTPGYQGATGTTARILFAAAQANGTAITAYQVQISTSSGFGSTVYDNEAATLLRDVTGLSAGTTYFVRVRANSAAGYGAWSSVMSFYSFAGLHINVGGTWYPVELWTNVGGTWYLLELWRNNVGTWRREA